MDEHGHGPDGNYPEVTRIEVIDSTGRAFVAYYKPGVLLSVQDKGRTIKLFAGERVESSDVLGAW